MKNIVCSVFAAAAIFVASLAGIGCAAVNYTVFGPDIAFSDDIVLTAKISGGRAQLAYDRMKKVVTDINAQVSLTNADSDLSRFNAAAAGEAVEVGKYCYDIFKTAVDCYELTGGAFNPAAAPLVKLWNLDAKSIASYRPEPDGSYASPELPSKTAVDEALGYCDPTLVEAVENGGKYSLKKRDGRVMLDFGGIAKGYAVDRCVDILNDYTIPSALIDISGNAYFYGKHAGSDWNVGIVSPRPRQKASRGYICAITTGGDVSAVTSGDYMRYYVYDRADGEKVYVPHIIGKDGVPIGVEYADGWKNSAEWVISATVIGKSSAVCDALSTAVSALGLAKGRELLAETGYKGLIFTEKRYTIIGDVALYKPDVYSEYATYGYYEH